MELKNSMYWQRIFILFALGAAGVFSALPIVPQLIAATGQEPPLPMAVIQALSTVQSLVILFAMVMLGGWASPKVKLGTPIVDAFKQGVEKPGA